MEITQPTLRLLILPPVRTFCPAQTSTAASLTRGTQSSIRRFGDGVTGTSSGGAGSVPPIEDCAALLEADPQARPHSRLRLKPAGRFGASTAVRFKEALVS